MTADATLSTYRADSALIERRYSFRLSTIATALLRQSAAHKYVDIAIRPMTTKHFSPAFALDGRD